MYQRQFEISERPVAIAFDEQGNTADAAKENKLEEDKADEFDQSITYDLYFKLCWFQLLARK